VTSLKLVLALVLFGIGGAVAGYFAAPSHAADAEAAHREAAAAQTAAKVESDRAEGLQKQVDVLAKSKAELEAKLAGPAAAPAPDATPAAAPAAPPAIDMTVGEVAICNGEIHIGVPQYVDRAHLKKLAKALTDVTHDTITLRGARANVLARQLRAAGRLDVATVNEGIEIVIK